MTDNLKRRVMAAARNFAAAWHRDESMENPRVFKSPEAERILEEQLDLYTAKVIEEAMKQKDAEIAQLREQLAAFEGEPLVGWWHSGETEDESDFHLFKYGAGESCGRCIPLIRKPTSTTHLEAIKQEVRDKALEDAILLHEHEDVLAPIGNSVSGEARQQGWIDGTSAYREAIRAMKGGKS